MKGEISLGMKSRLTWGELGEALKELTYETHSLLGKLEEINQLLKKDALKASERLIDFTENVIIPHFEREEKNVFPAILKWKQSEEQLIKLLLEDHRIMLKMFQSYKNIQVSGW